MQDPEAADSSFPAVTRWRFPTFDVGAAGVRKRRRAFARGTQHRRTSTQDSDRNRDVVRGEGKDREGMEQLMETEV